MLLIKLTHSTGWDSGKAQQAAEMPSSLHLDCVMNVSGVDCQPAAVLAAPVGLTRLSLPTSGSLGHRKNLSRHTRRSALATLQDLSKRSKEHRRENPTQFQLEGTLGNCRNLSRKTRRSAGVQAAVCRSASSAATGSGTRAFLHTKRRAARSRASVCIAGHCGRRGGSG
jgi:hypothetical protein